MNIYEYFSEIESSSLKENWDRFPDSFNQTERAKLDDAFDLEVFDLVMKAYEIEIIYRLDQRDSITKAEYVKYGDGKLVPFTDAELKVFAKLDWSKLPHNLRAHIYDVIWLSNNNYKAAEIAAEAYYESYQKWFDSENCEQCIDYIRRAVELAAKIGKKDKKEDYLSKVYSDVVRMNGEDTSLLSISLIELLLSQNCNCDFNTIIPFTDNLITKNKGNLGTAHIFEKACYVKAAIYKKMGDISSENAVYVQYADNLMQEAERFITTPNDDGKVENRYWFMAEKNLKQAIELFQKHGASEKAIDAQKRLIEIQKEAIKHISMHSFKTDVSDLHEKFIAKYGNHTVHELIWDVVFAFAFQNKEDIRDDIIKKASISSLFPMEMLGSEGQTEFYLPPLELDDENNILMHMYNKAREYESIIGQTLGVWFILLFRKLNIKESDLDCIFVNNPIIPKGQEKDVQRGIYCGLTGHMSDALDKLAPKMENIIRNLAEMCGDLMTYYDAQAGIQQKKVLSQVFTGEKLKEYIDENILFTFDGLLQQKAGSNIRNKVGHGLTTDVECSTGDCIYFVMIVLKFCAYYCEGYEDEREKHLRDRSNDDENNKGEE